LSPKKIEKEKRANKTWPQCGEAGAVGVLYEPRGKRILNYY
jgi:hypothetical protein